MWQFLERQPCVSMRMIIGQFNNIQSTSISIADKKQTLKEAILFFNKYAFVSFDTYFYESTKKNISEFVKIEKSK